MENIYLDKEENRDNGQRTRYNFVTMTQVCESLNDIKQLKRESNKDHYKKQLCR